MTSQTIQQLNDAVAAETERCAKLCEDARPAGGRAWSPEQLACYEALSYVAHAMRSSAKRKTSD